MGSVSTTTHFQQWFELRLPFDTLKRQRHSLFALIATFFFVNRSPWMNEKETNEKFEFSILYAHSMDSKQNNFIAEVAPPDSFNKEKNWWKHLVEFGCFFVVIVVVGLLPPVLVWCTYNPANYLTINLLLKVLLVCHCTIYNPKGTYQCRFFEWIWLLCARSVLWSLSLLEFVWAFVCPSFLFI